MMKTDFQEINKEIDSVEWEEIEETDFYYISEKFKQKLIYYDLNGKKHNFINKKDFERLEFLE